jgi:hypothetical protein
MSSLRFIKAPPKPEDISEADWDKEWIGLEVGLASVFPSSLGYLGESPARVFDEEEKTWRHPTATDSIGTLTRKLNQYLWISREMLIHVCSYTSPSRPIILAWLEKPAQENRRKFAVSQTIAEYLP